MLTKIISSFEAQYKILSYRIDLYFHDCKLAIEVDKKSRQWRKYWLWNKKKKAIKQEIGYEFIRIDSDQEGFDVFRVIN